MVDEEKIEPTPEEEVEVKPVPVEEEPKEEVKPEAEPFPTKILVAFIFAVFGATIALVWNFSALFAIPCGIVALALLKNASTERQPFKTFIKAGLIAGKIEIPVGAVMGTVWIIVKIVEAVIKAAEAAGA